MKVLIDGTMAEIFEFAETLVAAKINKTECARQEVLDETRRLLDKPISAIKYYRSATGCTLIEAKELIDRMRAKSF